MRNNDTTFKMREAVEAEGKMGIGSQNHSPTLDLHQVHQGRLAPTVVDHPIPRPPLQFQLAAKTRQTQDQRIFEIHRSYIAGLNFHVNKVLSSLGCGITCLDGKLPHLVAYGSCYCLEWRSAVDYSQSAAVVEVVEFSGYLLLKTEGKWIPRAHAFRGLFF